MSSSTIVVRPSEQSRNTSSGARPDGDRVDLDVRLRAERRVITERCGWVSASSGVSRPERTSSATSEWSSVTCSSVPSRTR